MRFSVRNASLTTQTKSIRVNICEWICCLFAHLSKSLLRLVWRQQQQHKQLHAWEVLAKAAGDNTDQTQPCSHSFSHTHTHKSLNTPGYCLDRLEVCIKQCLCLKSSALCHQTHCKSANVLIIDQSATSNQMSSIWFSLLISKLLKRTETANVRHYSDQNGRQMNNVCHVD